MGIRVIYLLPATNCFVQWQGLARIRSSRCKTHACRSRLARDDFCFGLELTVALGVWLCAFRRTGRCDLYNKIVTAKSTNVCPDPIVYSEKIHVLIFAFSGAY